MQRDQSKPLGYKARRQRAQAEESVRYALRRLQTMDGPVDDLVERRLTADGVRERGARLAWAKLEAEKALLEALVALQEMNTGGE